MTELVKRIETYSLYEFCDKVQEAIKEGWVFDFESNENFPTAFGSLIVAGMVKVKVEEVNEDQLELDLGISYEEAQGTKPEKTRKVKVSK
jgi:hypothetical protein